MTSDNASPQPAGPAEHTPHLYLVRHGEFPSNPLGLLDTEVPGQPLNAKGREQAGVAGEQLIGLGSTASAVYHSQAERAKNTAQIISGALGVEAVEVPGAFEVQAGELEKRGDPDALATYRSYTHAWMRGSDLASALPGGESGEDVRARIFPQIEKLYREHVSQGRDAVLVIHGTLIRVTAGLLGAIDGDFSASHAVPNCGIIGLIPAGDGELGGAASWACDDWAGTTPQA